MYQLLSALRTAPFSLILPVEGGQEVLETGVWTSRYLEEFRIQGWSESKSLLFAPKIQLNQAVKMKPWMVP